MKKIICFVVSLICVVSVCATSVAAEFHCVKDKTKYSYTKELSGVGFGRARGSKLEVFTEAYVSSSFSILKTEYSVHQCAALSVQGETCKLRLPHAKTSV